MDPYILLKMVQAGLRHGDPEEAAFYERLQKILREAVLQGDTAKIEEVATILRSKGLIRESDDFQ